MHLTLTQNSAGPNPARPVFSMCDKFMYSILTAQVAGSNPAQAVIHRVVFHCVGKP